MDTLDNDLQSSENLEVGRITRYNWLKISNWALFMAITGFVVLTIALIGLSTMVQAMETMLAMTGETEAFGLFQVYGPYFIGFFVLVLSVQFLINYFQLRFALQLKRAMDLNEQQRLESAWMHFRNLFRTVGILTIAIISLYILFYFLLLAFPLALPSPD